jgi:3-phosphoshikimate 1-carboxyvinyltransferase
VSFPVSISLPRSKSIVIRCLIIHYLRTGKLLPVFDNDPNDIIVVKNALEKIVTSKKTSVDIIDVQDCGAAYRFLMALLAATPGKWLLTGTPRLLERPILPLVDFLNANGAVVAKANSGWHIEGADLQIDNFEIDTIETSQYLSAVMMVAFGMRCTVCGDESEGRKQKTEGEAGRGSLYENPYITMTQTLLLTPNLDESRLLYLSDWSAAVFWFANALLVPNAHYLLKNLHLDELQGDAEIASWFNKWGISFAPKKQGVEIKHIENVDITEQKMDMRQTPDIALIMAVLSVCYPFELTMAGLKNLNLKESNRFDIMVRELSQFTKIEKQTEDTVTIYKRTNDLPKLFQFDSYNDHRFVMAWSLFKSFGVVNIQNADCVKKSYPGF